MENEKDQKIFNLFKEHLEAIFISSDPKFMDPYIQAKNIIQARYNKDSLCQLNKERIMNFISNTTYSDQEVLKYCINNIEYIKENCKVDEVWNEINSLGLRSSEFKRQIHKLIKFG